MSLSSLPVRRMFGVLLVGIFFLFLGLSLLSPNPYGNNPDVIADESYFLTSSLSAIEKHTLPGWEFSASGNYYGGTQTYIDTVVLVPVVAIIVATHHFSITATEGYIATHTGELLHIVRLINGAVAILTIALLAWFFRKKEVPKPLAGLLVFYLLLLLSNALVVQLLHTAKVWDFYIIIVSAVSALFLAQQYYLQHLGRPFLSTKAWTAILVWSGLAVFFQNYVGAFSIALIAAYAVYLGQVTISDGFRYIRKYWYVILALCVTQISFIYRAIFINLLSGSFSNISVKTSNDHVVWMLRVVNPVLYAILGDPLTLLYIVGVVGVVVWWLRVRPSLSTSAQGRYLLVALIHPLIVYVFFGILVGFDSAPRYGVILSTAVAFSIVIMVGELEAKWRKIITWGGIALSGTVFAFIGVQAIHLYWQFSSEVILERTIDAYYDSPSSLFLEEPSALRLTLPINEASLGLLNEKRAGFGRFAFLRMHPELVAENISFKSRTLTAYSDEEEAAAIAHLRSATTTMWTISATCEQRCTHSEALSNSCFEINISACNAMLPAQEVNFLIPYLRADQLGYPYIVRKQN
jgi:hypothetical protein